MKLLLLLLLAGTAFAEDRTVDASVYGAVLGPVDHPLTESEREALQDQFDVFAAAMTALAEGRAAEAATGFEAVSAQTGWYEAAYNGALAQRSAGEWAAALPLCDAALVARPGDAPAAFLKSSVLLTVGRHRDAEGAAAEALAHARKARNPLDTAVGLLNLGAAQRMLGNTEAALASYGEAAKLGEQLGLPGLVAAAQAGVGFSHAVEGRATEARTALAAASKAGGRARGDDFAEVELALAGMALAQGKTADAEAIVDRVAAIKLDDDTREAQLRAQLAGLQRELGQTQAADKSLRRAESLVSGTDLVVLQASLEANRASWRLEDGDAAGAATALESVVAKLSLHQAPLTLAGARLRLAQARLELEEYEASQAQLDALRASLDGTGATELRRQALVIQSESYRRQDRFADSLGAVDAAIALSPGDGPVRGRLRAERVVLLSVLGRVDDALAEASGMSVGQRSGLPARTRARMELQLGHGLHRASRFEEAERRGRAAVEAAGDPEDPELLGAARDLVVHALLAQERPDEAKAFLAAEGLGNDALAGRVEGDRLRARFNAGVDAYNGSDYEAAAAAFAEVEAAGAENRLEAARNRRAALLLWGQGLLGDGNAPLGPWQELAALAPVDGDEHATLEARLLIAEFLGTEDPAAGAAAATEAAQLAHTELAGRAWNLAGELLFDTDGDGARAAFEAALASWGQTPGTLPNRAMAHFNLGLLAWNADRPDDARSAWEAARTLATEAGLPDLAAQATAELKSLD